MQQGLDSMLKDPAVAASPMGKELIEDAQDEQVAAQAKLAANDGCDRDADARLEASGLGLVVAIVALLAGERVLAALRRRRRARQAARDRVAPVAPLAVLRCPACGAELDDPLGCWNCGAFEDGDVWRTPTAAPPDAARQLSLSSLDDRRRRRR